MRDMAIAYVEIGFAYPRRLGGLKPVHLRHRIWKDSQQVEMSMEFSNGESQGHSTVSLDRYHERLQELREPGEPRKEEDDG